VPRTRQEGRPATPEITRHTTILEHGLEKFVPVSPPRCPTQSLSCVFLI
jgi:hypothetical protein